MHPTTTYHTDSGLEVIVLHCEGLNSQEVTLAVRGGPRFESRDTSGLSHLVEHMLFRGTHKYPSHRDFHQAVESIGGPLLGCTGRDMSMYSLVVSPRDLERALDLLSEATLRPTFSDLELERRLVLEELLEERDEEDRELDLENVSRRLLWPCDPLGLPIVGSRRNIERFTVDDIREHHRRTYRAGNGLLVVAGPADPQRVLKSADRAFGDMPAGQALPLRPLRPTRPGPLVHCIDHEASQVEVMLSFRTVGILDPRAQGVALLQIILGDGVTSRLQWNVCERRALAYNITALYEPLADAGVLDVEAAVAPEGLLDLVREILSTLRDLKDRGPAADEFERARHRYRLALEFALDSPSALAQYHLSALFDRPYGIAERLEALDRWTLSDLRVLARQLLSRAGATLVAVGPFDELDRRKIERQLRGL